MRNSTMDCRDLKVLLTYCRQQKENDCQNVEGLSTCDGHLPVMCMGEGASRTF
ncbi:UNVERIFIED_CONTAM: hypothetical protein FKN15_003726 [Acipenser sinensis]